jgi:hypothetical protein
MSIEKRVRSAEDELFARSNLKSEESFFDLPTSGLGLRVLSVGCGPELVMLHGVSLSAAIWVP